MNLGSLVLVAALALGLFWAVGAHKRLTRLRARVVAAFAALDALLMRERVWLQGCLPESLRDGAPTAPAPLDEPLAAAWRRLQAAGEQVGAALAVARTRPLNADATASLSAAHGVLDLAWEALCVEAAGQDLDTVTEQLSAAEAARTKIVHQGLPLRDAFNQAVVDYNAAIRQFPALLLAGLLRYRPAGVLEIATQHAEP